MKKHQMIGAIAGDIIGSRYEFNNIKTKKFPLFEGCMYTDDSVMTLALMRAIIECNGDYGSLSVMSDECMHLYGLKHPYSGYGDMFRLWLNGDLMGPYNSYGNGAAMRVSPVAYIAKNIDEVKKFSDDVTKVTHNHPEGLKGAEATAVATYLALTGTGKEDIKKYIQDNYYDIDFTIDGIRFEYEFEASCQMSVPQALEAFFESEDYEDAIRNVISIGGDSDTLAAIAGAVAGAYYGVPDEIYEQARKYLVDEDLKITYDLFEQYISQTTDKE